MTVSQAGYGSVMRPFKNGDTELYYWWMMDRPVVVEWAEVDYDTPVTLSYCACRSWCKVSLRLDLGYSGRAMSKIDATSMIGPPILGRSFSHWGPPINALLCSVATEYEIARRPSGRVACWVCSILRLFNPSPRHGCNPIFMIKVIVLFANRSARIA